MVTSSIISNFAGKLYPFYKRKYDVRKVKKMPNFIQPIDKGKKT